MYAHMLARRLAEVRKSALLPFILPDGKSQVTFEYDENAGLSVSTPLLSRPSTPTVCRQ